MRNKLSIFVLCILLLATGCSQKKPPVEVSIEEIQGVPVLHVVSTVDSVHITGFKVNRGNCNGSISYQLPVEVVFGGDLKVFAHGCNVKELLLDTDHGSFSFSF